MPGTHTTIVQDSNELYTLGAQECVNLYLFCCEVTVMLFSIQNHMPCLNAQNSEMSIEPLTTQQALEKFDQTKQCSNQLKGLLLSRLAW